MQRINWEDPKQLLSAPQSIPWLIRLSILKNTYDHEKTRLDRGNNWQELADRLGLPLNFGKIKRGTLVRLVSKTVDNFCYSDDGSLSIHHIPEGPWVEGKQDHFLTFCEDLWARTIKKDEKRVPIKPHHITKMWGLREGIIPSEYSIVLCDEAQDINPVFISILKRSKCRLMLIGDTNQQLYGWRGARNSLPLFDGETYFLTQTWRYGPAIAALGNKILSYKEMPPSVSILGNSGIHSNVIRYGHSMLNAEWPTTAMLCRTNMHVFEQASRIAGKAHKLHVMGLDYLEFALSDALKLYNGEFDAITHPLIMRFPRWEDLMIEVEMTDDPELKRIATIIEERHEVLDHMLKSIRRHHENDERRAPLILSTTHKVKGREWDRVILGNDFISTDRFSNFKPGEKKDDELNILYVAATRAIRELYIPESLGFY